MKRNRWRLIGFLLVLVLVAAAIPGCGSTGDNDGEIKPVVFKFASDTAIGTATGNLNEEAIALIEERTEGRVKIDYYPAAQLGSYTVVFEEMMLGTIDMGQLTVPEHIDPRLAVGYTPYFATSYEQIKKLYSADAFITKACDEILSEHDITFMGWAIAGFRAMGSVPEIKDYADPTTNKRISIRIPPYEYSSILMSELGYTPVTIPWAEVSTSLQTKVVDAWVGGSPFHNRNMVGDIINYLYIPNKTVELTAYVISDKSLNKVSEEDAKIIKDTFAEMSMRSIDVAETFDNENIQKIKDDGVTVVEYTDEEKAVMAKYVRDNVWPKLEPIFSKELMDGLRDEINKYGY